MAVIPKRSDQLIRRNIPDVPVTKIEAAGTVKVPPLGIKDPHPMVAELYRAMKKSAQAHYYEPTDWSFARITLHYLDKSLKQAQPSAMLLSSIDSMLTRLLLTEGDRRRMRLEVERKQTALPDNVVSISQVYREKLGG
jgi:hypothetical protein